MFKVTTSFTEKELDAYATAGGIAEEVLSGIKTVTAFSGQHEELTRYNKHLKVAKSVGIKKNISTGFSLGTLFLVLFSAYGLGFWYGGKLIVGEGTVQNWLVIKFSQQRLSEAKLRLKNFKF